MSNLRLEIYRLGLLRKHLNEYALDTSSHRRLTGGLDCLVPFPIKPALFDLLYNPPCKPVRSLSDLGKFLFHEFFYGEWFFGRLLRSVHPPIMGRGRFEMANGARNVSGLPL
jgi:hypothetical protein